MSPFFTCNLAVLGQQETSGYSLLIKRTYVPQAELYSDQVVKSVCINLRWISVARQFLQFAESGQKMFLLVVDMFL